ncbi:hypothetical protein L6164_015354 [Bauhinia variegata]|uniref:Uncharacterized protein n=1 Tax=Bauhinia variegata TaxID=167791 RepID=A0ACB9NKW7_BAUVA|nr:hypothetical protein L6164_015354 [Bauhinia variegata]
MDGSSSGPFGPSEEEVTFHGEFGIEEELASDEPDNPELEKEEEERQIREHNNKKRNCLTSNSFNKDTLANSDKVCKSSKKPTRPPSWAWDHFTEKSIKGVMTAVCNQCGTYFASDRKRNETSNLIGHLMRQCKKFPKELRDPRQMVLFL